MERQAPDPEQLLTVADIAGHIGAHEQTVRLWIKRGELTASKFGTRIGYRIRRADYDAFIARRTLMSRVSQQQFLVSRASTCVRGSENEQIAETLLAQSLPESVHH